MKNILYCTLFFAFILACSNNKLSQPQNQIEFIFKNYPQAEDDLGGKYSASQAKILLLDNDKPIVLSPKKANDTLLIKVESVEHLLLIHRFTTVSGLDIVLKNGDKVLVDYKGHFPILKITNRKTLKYDCQLDSLILAKFGDKMLSPMIVYVTPLMKFDLAIVSKIGLPAAKKAYLKLQTDYFDKSMTFLQQGQSLIDSLRNQNELSNEVYTVFKERIELQTQTLKASEQKIDLQDFSSFLKTYQPLGIMEDYYKTLLETGYDTLMVKKQKTYFDFKDGVNRDYRESFEALSKSDLFTEKDKAYLLCRETKRIGYSFNKSDFLAYFDRLKTMVKDTGMINPIQREFALKFIVSDETKTAKVLDSNKKALNFDAIVSQNKIIYLDFWASWCGPCRAEMPASKTLKAEYEKQGVKFIYISTDQDLNAWAKAVKQIGLLPNESYVLPDGAESAIYKQFKIASIPRYMIFGKDGKVINADAPRPSDPRIKQVFDELLKHK